jgi:hypothetical protein
MRLTASLMFSIGIAAALCACSSFSMGPPTLFVDPAKYDFHNCAQLATARTVAAERELELKLLMDKAERGAGGAFVNVIAYQSDYTAVREDLKLIDATAREKRCPPPAAAASGSSTLPR